MFLLIGVKDTLFWKMIRNYKFYKFPGKDFQLKGNIFWQEHDLREDRKVNTGGIKIHKLNSVA